MTDDIIDDIDHMVDDQIAGGEPFAPDRFSGSAEYPRCSHCDRHWHGLPITERISQMYQRGEFDEDYRAEVDDSRVLCRGSYFIGPMPAERGPSTMTGNGEVFQLPEWLVELIDDTSSFVAEQIDSIVGAPFIHPDVIREMIEQPNPLLGEPIPRNRGCALLVQDDTDRRADNTAEPWRDFHVALRRGVEHIRESMTGTTTSVDDPDLAETTAPMTAEERARRTIESIISLVQTISNLVQDYSNR